jgi:hypothetical protein
MRHSLIHHLGIFICILALSFTAGATPSFIHYQGYLTDKDTNDPVHGLINMTFTIYDAETNGNDIWSEVRSSTVNEQVDVKNGKFHVKLGEYSPLTEAVFSESGRWLGIVVDGEELSTRTPIGSVPYAFMAGTVPDKTVGHEKIKNKAIADSLIDDKAVGHDKIKNKAIVDSLIDDKAVGHDKIKNKAIADSLIDDKAVGQDKIKNKAIVDSLIDDAAILTDHIRDYTILFTDFDTNDAVEGDVIKWDGSLWSASPDLFESASSGWEDNGTTVSLATSTDYVSIGSDVPNGPLHVNDQNININTANLSNKVAPFIIESSSDDNALLIDVDQIEYSKGGSTLDILYLNRQASSSVALVMGGGNVGIGTDNPSSKLTVNGELSIGSFKMSAGHSPGYVLTCTSPGVGTWQPANNGDVTDVIGGTGLSDNASSGDITISHDAHTGDVTGATVLTIASNAVRESMLDCSNPPTDGYVLAYESGTSQFEWVAPTSNNGWVDDGTNVRLATITDNVGIGITTPAEKLDVSGNIHASGTITSGTSITIDGTTDKITASGGTIDFDNENLVTTGKVKIGPGNSNGGDNAFTAGSNNTAGGDNSCIGGGINNQATYINATVAGGQNNKANSQNAAVGGGAYNEAMGNTATIPGGLYNRANTHYTFAAGSKAKALHEGAVVIAADNSGLTVADSIASGGAEQMVLRADGGLYITNTFGGAPYDNTNIITTRGGAYLSGNGTNWTNSSDRNLKENFTIIDRNEILELLSQLKITRWNYKEDNNDITHIGPVAQDFYALFGLGKNERSISTIDPSGIALAAIQELYRQNQSQMDEIQNLKSEINRLNNEKMSEIEDLQIRLKRLTTIIESLAIDNFNENTAQTKSADSN